MNAIEPTFSDSPLPYRDTKPQGAAGFYLSIGATARFIRDRMGFEKLVQYWRDLGRGYFRPVSERWLVGGLPAVAAYWRAFFAAEPGAEAEVELQTDRVVVTIRRCPIVHYNREHGRELIAEFCQHCYHVSDAMGERASITARISGGNGQCRQEFLSREHAQPQDLNAIARCQ
jgi:hypothetical protein